MKPFRTLPLLLALALPAAFAADPCNDTCKALVHEGQVLQAQGQNGPAYAKYKAASEAAPQASVPLSSTAVLMYTMSLAAKAEQADKLRAGKDPSDPALLRMQVFARDGQLEPAILLLLFRQAYRPSLEAWLAAHPGGVKTFIDRYGLQP